MCPMDCILTYPKWLLPTARRDDLPGGPAMWYCSLPAPGTKPGGPQVLPLCGQLPGFCVGLVPMMDGKVHRFRTDSKVLSWVAGDKGKEYREQTRRCFPPGEDCSASITRPDHLADWDLDRLVSGWSSVFAHKTVLYIRPAGAMGRPDGDGKSTLQKVAATHRRVFR